MSDLEKRLAAYLSELGAAPVAEEMWLRVDLQALLARLRRNKVPLLSVQRWHSHAPVWETRAFQDALRTEQESLNHQRVEFARVQEALAGADISTALIKSAGIAPSFPYRSDNVDLLVPLEMGQKAAELLYDLGYVELRNIEEPHKFLFKRFVGGREVSAIHLHEQVGWGTGFLVEAWVWERVVPSPDDSLVSTPGREDSLLVTLAHAFYEDKEFKIWDLAKARYCIGADGFDWDYCARQAEERGWLHGLNAILEHASRVERRWFAAPVLPSRVPGHGKVWAGWEAGYGERLASAQDALPAPVPFVYSKRHYFTKVSRDRALSRRRKWDDALRHALAGVRRNLKIRSQRPMLIAISGVDGSGKTTHAEAVQQAFGRCDIRARLVWSRGASSPFTDALIRVGKRLVGGPQGAETSESRSALERRARMWRRAWVRRLWPWVLAFDLWRTYLTSIAWPLLWGWIVIADRYVADAQAEVAAYLDEAGVQGLPLALRLLAWASPRPTMHFLLDVPADVAAGRAAGAESPSFLARQAAHYRNLTAARRLSVLDATRPQEEVSSEIVRAVLLRYYHRYRTVVNGLFLFNPRAKRPFLERD